MNDEIKVGACIGTNHLKSFVKYGLGNYVYLHLPGIRHIMMDGPEVVETEEQLEKYRNEAVEAARYCREHGIYFTLAEIRNRRRLVAYSPYRKEDYQAMQTAGGKYFLGRFTVG